MYSRTFLKTFTATFFFFATATACLADADNLWSAVSRLSEQNWTANDELSSQQLAQLQQLAKAGDANAQYALGRIHMAKHEHPAAAQWLKQAAAQGHIPAEYAFASNAKRHNAYASAE